MTTQIQKLPDPHGMISRIKSRLPRNCAVARSPYCEVIISMRMQGIDFRSIEKWLIEQGDEFRISSPTICKNLLRTKLSVELPYAEELAEKWGGRIDLDLARELAGQVIAQRKRVDLMQRQEEEKQKHNKRFFDKRLRQERDTLVEMTKTLHSMMKSPLDAANEALAASGLLTGLNLSLSADATAVLKDLLLSGEMQFGETDSQKHGAK